MNYKLYEGSTNDIHNITKEILTNRGIKDYERYLNLDESEEIPYLNLDNIEKAVEIFDYHYVNKQKICVLVDEDIDGITSAAIMINYIKLLDKDYPVEYILHKKTKAHGLGKDVIVPDDTKLLIIPDAGTNDVTECKELKDKGIDIIILDHHESEVENNHATIINNQMCSYENKFLSGVGIVYKFLRAIDEFYWFDYADNFIDLVALGMISDSMDIRSYETKYLVQKGLNHINNKAFIGFIKSQEYQINGIVNQHNISWYISPLINAMIRIGSSKEKELLFQSFLEWDQIFDYQKRATKSSPAQVIEESIYDRVPRLCKNAKSRQDKMREKGTAELQEQLLFCGNDKVIILDATNKIPKGLTGVVAIKISESYGKPCLVLVKRKNKNVFGGSGRNYDYSPIDNFKDVINDCDTFDFAQGHQNAFGIQLKTNKFKKAKKVLNKMLQGVNFISQYYIDFELTEDDLNVSLIKKMDDMKDFYGAKLNESLFLIKDIFINKSDVEIFGKQSNTLTFKVNDIKFLLFKADDGNPLYDWASDIFGEDNDILVDIIGKASMKEYKGYKTAQIIIEAVEIKEYYKSENTEDVWGA